MRKKSKYITHPKVFFSPIHHFYMNVILELVFTEVKVSVAQSCPTLCDPVDCSPAGSSVHGDSPGKNTGMGCYALLQQIFPTQGWSPGFLHCRWILYQLSYLGSPIYMYMALGNNVLFSVYFTLNSTCPRPVLASFLSSALSGW